MPEYLHRLNTTLWTTQEIRAHFSILRMRARKEARSKRAKDGKMAESVLVQAIRNVEEGEKRVAQQQLLVRKLEKEGSEISASDARLLLAAMQESLALMRDHVRIERAKGMN